MMAENLTTSHSASGTVEREAVVRDLHELIARECLDEAELLVSGALPTFSGELEVLRLAADIAMRRRDWCNADQRWSAVREIDRRYAPAHVLGARALDELHQYAKADAVLSEAWRNLPDDPWIAEAWANHALEKEPNIAVERFQVAFLRFPDSANFLVGLIRALLRTEAIERAESALQTALERFPEDRHLLTMFAETAMRRKDWLLALDRWAVLRARVPREASSYVYGARALSELGRHEDADLLLQEGVMLAQDDPWLVSSWAGAPALHGDWKEAARRWADATNWLPDQRDFNLHYARALMASGDLTVAEEMVEGALSRFPDNGDILRLRAELASRVGTWDEAVRRWGRLIELRPDDSHAVIEQSRALNSAGQLSEAEALLTKARNEFPRDTAIATAWAELSMRRQLWAEAARRWEHLRAEFPSLPAAWVEGARALGNARQSELAEAVLTEGQERFPDNCELLVRWAELPRQRVDCEEGLRRWTMVRERFPDEPRGWIEAAVALGESHRAEDGDALLESAVHRFPKVFDVSLYWALLGARIRPKEVALARWEEVRQRFPNHCAAYGFSVHCLDDFGLKVEADNLIAEALRRFPNELDPLRAYAALAVRRGELETAADRYRVCVNRFPGDISVARSYIDTLISLQRTDEACAALDQARHVWPLDPGFLRQRLMLAVNGGEVEEAFALWQSLRSHRDIDAGAVREVGLAMLRAGLAPAQAREVLLFLACEPDTGTRDWLPVLWEIERFRDGPIVEIGRDLVSTVPADEFEQAAHDVLRCVLLMDITDEEILRFIRDYVAKGRRALTAKLFCQNYWKPKPSRVADFTRVFEAYIGEKLANPAWLNGHDRVELLGYLNFAAVFSTPVFRQLVGLARTRLNTAAMSGNTSLQSIESVVASIVANAPDNHAVSEKVDDLRSVVPAPALALTPRRLRIAVCVSGQLRGYRAAFPTWKKLELDRHHTAYFVHVWKDIGHNWQRMWVYLKRNPSLFDAFVRPNGISFLQSRYPGMIDAALRLSSSEADDDELQNFYGTPHVVIEDDRESPFLDRNNFWKMHYKIEQTHRFALRQGGDFDLMLRIRPDREVTSCEVDWRELYWRASTAHTLFVDQAYVYTEETCWVGDQFAGGTPRTLDVYANFYSDFTHMLETQKVPLDAVPRWIAHRNLFYLLFYRGILAREAPGLVFGRLLDPAMLSPEEVLSLVRHDIAQRQPDPFDEELINVSEAEINRRESNP